ncbi:CDF family Co(II)/Ni(II) efflux transporter DmeF [Mesorhizobium sp. J428]|uniref:CDF family Co(II)/Ni(II) efflux transporter DmeF n=1 Tax=Mesorhizobium sp. J428 TaxID=2898440 RepID=UPI0021509708|nr:CDF family Co(II)/Ni(II) efflux transporter DmeF [Mesorhizobium sp. J428]MCR5857403.1 CDF family Co(II)/Ni(II) efflux transporter DmeF [Mesorhizobium sp. J428]
MHSQSIENWRHPHVFLGADHARNEWRTWIVVALTTIMMVGEIVAGMAFGSMALLADGFHMATHAGALSIAGFAYWYARRHAHDERFSFGTGKLGELAGYSSAVILAIVALMIGVESVLRLTAPVPIRFTEAIFVAVIGLIVNLASAWFLHAGGGEDRNHHHDHEHAQDDDHHHHGHDDHNLRSAYFHVLTDALTSVLAIVALLAGRFYGWLFMDPLMGIVGSVVIARWSWGLLKGAGAVLLDMKPDKATANDIRTTLEQNGDRVADLHLWRVGPGHMAAIVSIISDRPQEPAHYKARLARFSKLSHVTVEVHPCRHIKKAA